MNCFLRISFKSICSCVFLLFSLTTFSQGFDNTSAPTVIRPFGFVTEVAVGYKKNDDPLLLEGEWKEGKVMLLNGLTVEDRKFKYDIRHDVFEFDTDQNLRYLSGGKVIKFEIQDGKSVRKFYNALYIQRLNANGFVELLQEGDYKLYELHTFEVKKADYNKALDVGSRQDKILKKSRFYFYTDKRGELITRSKKKLVSLFGPSSNKAKETLSEKKYKINKKEDLQEFFAMMNN